jgi:uncharacterized protein
MVAQFIFFMPMNLQRLFSSTKVIAVVGLSAEPDRASYGVALYLQEQGFQVVPVTPKYDQVLGQKAYKNLSEIPFAVDIVNVFRRTDDVLPIAREALALKPQCFWQQLGIDNEEAHLLVEQHSILSIKNQCIKIEHRQLTRE